MHLYDNIKISMLPGPLLMHIYKNTLFSGTRCIYLLSFMQYWNTSTIYKSYSQCCNISDPSHNFLMNTDSTESLKIWTTPALWTRTKNQLNYSL